MKLLIFYIEEILLHDFKFRYNSGKYISLK